MFGPLAIAWLLPARGGAGAVIVVFAILFTLAEHAGYFGIPLTAILVSWSAKYAYVLFEHRVSGSDETPVLDIQMVNPFEQRPLGQLLIVGAVLGLAACAHLYQMDWLALIVLVTGLGLLPASIAVLGLESNLIRAANPLVLLRLVRSLGWRYGLALLLMLLSIAAAALLWRSSSWRIVDYLVSLFLLFSFFAALAHLLYDRRLNLGLEVRKSPEIDAETKRRNQARLDERLVDEAYGLFRARHHEQAWQTLIDWLKTRGNQPREFDFLCARLKHWPDTRYHQRMCQEYIERLLESGKPSAALKVAEDAMRSNADFRPRTAESTLALARAAAAGGARSSARRLLADFERRFGGHAAIPAAMALAQSISDEP